MDHELELLYIEALKAANHIIELFASQPDILNDGIKAWVEWNSTQNRAIEHFSDTLDELHRYKGTKWHTNLNSYTTSGQVRSRMP